MGFEKYKDMILQFTALLFINILAILYDSTYVYYAYLINALVLGVNLNIFKNVQIIANMEKNINAETTSEEVV